MHDIPGHASESNKNLFTFSTKSTTNQWIPPALILIVEFLGFGHLRVQKSPKPQRILHKIIHVPLLMEVMWPSLGNSHS
jgi:hypothetical protein